MMFPAPLVAALVVIASAASASGTYYVINAKRNAELVRMYKAGEKALVKKQEIVNEYTKEITDLRNRPPKRVPDCSDLPSANSSGSDASGTGAADQRDIGPLLREALDELIRCNAMREAAK